MSFEIRAIGLATPPHRIEQSEAAEIAATLIGATDRERDLWRALYRRSGVRTRHSVLLASSTGGSEPRQTFYGPKAASERGPTTAARMAEYERAANDLAAAAAGRALDRSGQSAGELTHLVTVSCSGFSAPGFDLGLIPRLGLRPGVARTHIGFMGCHGALNGLRIARALAASEPGARVMLCALELCSLHHQYSHVPNRIVSNALFADGAAAIIGQTEEPRSAPGGVMRLLANATTVVPGTEDAMGWRIGDYGYEMQLSPQVPDLLRHMLRAWVESWLSGLNRSIDHVGSWAIHPGGPRILSACADCLRLDADALAASYEVLADYGNMSSPTLLFILDRLRRAGRPGPCVALGFGPGLTIEAALFDW